MITRERLLQALSYDPVTGFFTWLISTSNRSPVGSIAGCVGKAHGYVVIRLDNVLYRAHRLAWLFVYGVFPQNDIDHRNGDRADNRLVNLRSVTRGQNLQNKTHYKSELLGTGYCKRSRLWRARIMVDGRDKHIGLFQTAEDAHTAYRKAKALYHPFSERL